MTRTSKRIELLAEKKFEAEKAAAAKANSETIEIKMEAAKLSNKLPEKNFNSGLWTEQEDAALLKSLKKNNWGTWKIISEEIKTRSPLQIETKVAYYRNRKPSKPEDPSSIHAQTRLIINEKHQEFINRSTDNSVSEVNEVISGEFVSNNKAEHERINEPVLDEISEISEPLVTEPMNEPIEIPQAVESVATIAAELTEVSETFENEETRPMEAEVTEIETVQSVPTEHLAAEFTAVPEPMEIGATDTETFEFVPSKTVVTEHEPVKFEPMTTEVIDTQETMETGPVQDEVMQSESIKSPESMKSETFDEPMNSEPTEANETLGSVVAEPIQMMTEDIEMTPQLSDNVLSDRVPIESKDESVINEEPTLPEGSEEQNVTNEPTSKKRTRKTVTSATVATKTPKSSPAKTSKATSTTPAGTATKKRAYNRKNVQRPSTPVNVGEEVSILSSSPSDGSAKESINIMSSSDSNDSIPKSENSVSNDSLDSLNSSKSVDSASSKNSYSSFVIEEWERKACTAIFEKANLLNPEKRYMGLKMGIKKMIDNNPNCTTEAIFEKYKNSYSLKSIEQVIEVLRFITREGSIEEMAVKGAEVDEPIPIEAISKADSVPLNKNEDIELLKKMSSTSSGRKRKIRSEEGEWIDPNEIEGRVISHEPVVKEKRKRKTTPKKEQFEEDLNSSEDPFRLILLNDYDDVNTKPHEHNHNHSHESEDILKAPFTVEMCTSVILLMDMHSHLHSSEIIGLLGGTFNNVVTGELPVLKINFGFPCSTSHSTGTQVDVDPLSEMEAGEFFESKQVRMAGWYHSHPNFEPNPSLRDLETQIMYQGLFKNSQPDSDIEPFVGVIVNPYLAITESSSHVECFYVAPNTDPNLTDDDRLPYRIPIKRIPFDPKVFPEILAKMREILFRAESSPDRLDMNKNAQPGVKRIDKLLKSLQFHGKLNDEQMEQVKELFK